jgi:hypothetical protein
MSKQWIAAAFTLPLLWSPRALAQDYSQGDDGEQSRNRGEWHQKICTERFARKASHLAYLQAKLVLTDQQRPLWNMWRQSAMDTAEQRRTACLEHKPEMQKKPTALERAARMEKWLSARLACTKTPSPMMDS